MIFLRFVPALALGIAAVAAPRLCDAAEARGIYGIHDHAPRPTEYLNLIKSRSGGGGWVTATVEVGSSPYDQGGADFSSIAAEGHTVICRINNGYAFNGTIPVKAKYDDFATRCANFVKNSKGCNIWVIGNETNLAIEWPVEGGRLKYVSPQDYAECFRKAYNAIKAVRPDDRVVTQALAPWGGPYGSGELGGYQHDANPLNWVQYLRQMLVAIKTSGQLDGIALHINSRGYSQSDIHSTAKMSAGGQSLYSSFYVYKDWIDYGIPNDLYHLPLYATECNGMFYWKGGHPENPAKHYEPGWMQEIYAEIDRYNQQAVTSGKPVFRCVSMYRWCSHCDGWNIDGTNPYKAQIMSDLGEALDRKYTWPDSEPVIVDNSDPGFSVVSGYWSSGTGAPDKYGPDYRYNPTADGTGQDVARWTPALEREGMYAVSVWYPAGSNRASDAPYTVHSLNGDQTIRVNQQANGGQWNLLGTFPFLVSDGHVSLSDDAGLSIVLADAVRWDYKGELPSTGSLVGKVTDANGVPISGACVTLQPSGASACTDAQGLYTIPNVKAGLYSATAARAGYDGQTVEGISVGTNTRAQDFTLGGNTLHRIGETRALPAGAVVALAETIVSANAGASFWIQERDRSAAIRVAATRSDIRPGDVVSLGGLLGAYAGERAIVQPAIQVVGSGDPPVPVAVSCAAVGGPPGEDGTPGVTVPEADGVSTIGLLVKVFGRVSAVTSASSFYIDDGSALQDGSGPTGVRVLHWGEHAAPQASQYAAVTGNAGLVAVSGGTARAIWCGPDGSISVLAP